MTIYVDDLSGDICSGPLQVASIAQCYNATWAFYSIDMCDPAGAGNTNIPTLPSIAVSSTSSPSSSLADSAVAANSASASASAASSGGESNTGAIVGGVVGGVVGLALIIGATVFLTVRTLRKSRAAEAGEVEVSEVHADSAVPAQKPVVYEKMGNVPDLPPVELPVDMRDAEAGAKPPSN